MRLSMNRRHGILGSRARARIGAWVLLGILLLGVVPFSYSLVGVGHGTVTATGAPVTPSVVPASGYPTAIRHVIVTVFENQAYSTVMGNSEFHSVATNYAYASQFYSPCHPSSPNYVAMFTDSVLSQCGTDNVNHYNVSSLAQEFDSAGVSWAMYEQDMPSNCYQKDDGSVYYWAHHDPAVYVDYVTSNSAYCDAHVLTIGSAMSPAAWNSSAPPAFSWVQQGKGVYGLNTAAAFLKYDLSLWETKSWWANTVVLAVFDESSGTDTSCPPGGVDGLTGTCGGHTWLAAISPYTLGGSAYTTVSDHFSVYATIVWLLGLTPVSHEVGTAMESMFGSSSPSPPPPPVTQYYAVTGTVDNASGSTIPGATVYANNSSASLTATTGSAGNYSFSVANGSYQLTAIAPGYRAGSQNVTVDGAAASGVNFALANVPSPASKYALAGSVLADPNATAIGNATVYANSTTADLVATTSPNGTFRFLVENGSYQLTAVAAGFSSASTNVTVNGTAVPDVTLALSPSGVVAVPTDGVVRSGTDGTPISNATLFFSNGNATVSVETNSSGGYAVALPKGTYNVTVVAPGYVSTLGEVSVDTHLPADFNFTLSPATSSPPGPGGGSAPTGFPSSVYLLAIAGTCAAVGIAGWGLGLWARRTGRLGGGPRRKR